MFSSLVTDQWIRQDARALGRDDGFAVVDPSLTTSAPGHLLRISDGPTVLTLSAERARVLGITDGTRIDDGLTARLSGTGDDSDHVLVYYLTTAAQLALRAEIPDAETRELGPADRQAFDRLIAATPDGDVEEADVELDHWLVFGTFIDGRLVSAASMYPWGDTHLADLGVLTSPSSRGRGHGRATVRAISAAALERGYEPQYHCQFDNAASAALAHAAGFTLFADRETIG